MTDLLIGEDGDLVLEGGDLVLDTGLGSAVVRSLTTDRRATAEELERLDSTDPLGWWADDAGDPYGSGLWLLSREVTTRETGARAEELAREALEWILREGIASIVSVAATFPERGVLHIDVRIVRGTGTRWAHLWARSQPAHLETDHLTLAVLLEERAA